MADISEQCRELLEEYQALRRRLEEIEFTNPDLDDEPEGEITQEDRDRLAELKQQLDEECDIELPDEDESDVDIPEYAEESPSEPRDFDKE